MCTIYEKMNSLNVRPPVKKINERLKQFRELFQIWHLHEVNDCEDTRTPIVNFEGFSNNLKEQSAKIKFVCGYPI